MMATADVPEARCLLIGGFHRSGTSMTAEILHRAGLDLGRALILPDPSNSRGHFEDWDVVEAHDDILADNDTSWMYAAEEPPRVSAERLANLRRLLDERRQRGPWGVKDPRLCLFLDTWTRALGYPPGIVVVFRHYADCAASLRHRAARSVAWHPPNHQAVRLWGEPDLALRMWLVHNRALVGYAREHPERCLVIRHDRLLDGYPLVSEVNRRFGLDLRPTGAEAVRRELVSASGFDLGGVDAGLVQDLEATWHELNDLAGEARTGRSTARAAAVGQIHRPELDWLRAHDAERRPDARRQAVPTDGDALMNLRQPAWALDAYLRESEGTHRTLGLARAHLALGDLRQAEQEFRAVLAPDRIGVQIGLAEALLGLGRLEEAEELLVGSAVSRPEIVHVPLLLSSCCLRRGDPQAAVEVLRQAVERLSGAPRLRVALATALYRAGRPEQAVEQALRDHAAFPDHVGLAELTAKLLRERHREAEADTVLRRCAAAITSTSDYRARLLAALATVTDPDEHTDLEHRIAGHVKTLFALGRSGTTDESIPYAAPHG